MVAAKNKKCLAISPCAPTDNNGLPWMDLTHSTLFHTHPTSAAGVAHACNSLQPLI